MAGSYENVARDEEPRTGCGPRNIQEQCQRGEFGAVAKQGEIPAQFARLEKQIAILSEMAESLSQRLNPVTNDGMKQSTSGPQAVDASPQCELAHQVWLAKNGVEMISATIHGILNRLEL